MTTHSALSATDGLIFDVDGVLLDVERSFVEVIRQGIVMSWRSIYGPCNADCTPYGLQHEWVMKRHGAFNDDFDLTWALLCIAASEAMKKGDTRLSVAFPTPECLTEETSTLTDGDVAAWVRRRYDEPFQRESVRSLCTALYQGTEESPGLYSLEDPMLNCSWRELPMPVGIYTGRCLSEWRLATKRLGWPDFPMERVIHSDTGIVKPSPRGLELLCQRMGVASPLVFGDTASDWLAWKAFGQGSFIAIGNLLPEAPLSFPTPEAALARLIGFRQHHAS